MTHTPDEVIAKLGELSSDEIARLLRDSGVRAVRREPNYCAVSRYVRQETGTKIITGTERWRVSDDVDRNELPASVTSFVWKFDHDFYPDLIDREDEAEVYNLVALPPIREPSEQDRRIAQRLEAGEDYRWAVVSLAD